MPWAFSVVPCPAVCMGDTAVIYSSIFFERIMKGLLQSMGFFAHKLKGQPVCSVGAIRPPPRTDMPLKVACFPKRRKAKSTANRRCESVLQHVAFSLALLATLSICKALQKWPCPSYNPPSMHFGHKSRFCFEHILALLALS